LTSFLSYLTRFTWFGSSFEISKCY